MNDTTSIEFSTPNSINAPIIVSRHNSGKGNEVVGHIYQRWDESADLITYQCIGEGGEEIIPPTTDWIEAEKAFENFVRHYQTKSELEKSVERGEVHSWYSLRKNELKEIRKSKGRQTAISITK